MPKTTIYQEIWSEIRSPLVEAVVLVLKALIAVCLYGAIAAIFSYVLNTGVSSMAYAVIYTHIFKVPHVRAIKRL